MGTGPSTLVMTVCTSRSRVAGLPQRAGRQQPPVADAPSVLDHADFDRPRQGQISAARRFGHDERRHNG